MLTGISYGSKSFSFRSCCTPNCCSDLILRPNFCMAVPPYFSFSVYRRVLRKKANVEVTEKPKTHLRRRKAKKRLCREKASLRTPRRRKVSLVSDKKKPVCAIPERKIPTADISREKIIQFS